MTIKLVKGKAQQKLPEQPIKSWKPDDDDIALTFAEQWRTKTAFFHTEWKAYEAGVWNARGGSELRRSIRKDLRAWRAHGITVTQSRIKSLEAMLEDDLFITDRHIMAKQDEQRRYINLRNGLFNLETMKMEDHRPDLYFTTQLDFNYDENASAPTFGRYLKSSLVFPDSHKPDASLCALVMEALGYSMTARTDLKASFWLVGEKDSGKSTFIALIKSLMGALHTTLDLNQLGTNRFLLAGIVGKRVITFTEASGNTMLPDALYKTLVGGTDEVYADVKNRDPIAFRPEAKLWWAMNEMPRVSDRSGATTRRIYIIPFNRTIPQKDRIPDLEARLARERSGIFNEMIIFYKRLRNGGDFEHCQQSVDRRNQYIAENDTEATFVEDRAELHDSYKIQSSDLYVAYSNWCSLNGFHPKNRNQIAQEWRRLGFTSHKSNGVIVWIGIRLKSTM